ncbi:hypothetical protein ISCGN_008687 [Ixodes scapularis]
MLAAASSDKPAHRIERIEHTEAPIAPPVEAALRGEYWSSSCNFRKKNSSSHMLTDEISRCAPIAQEYAQSSDARAGDKAASISCDETACSELILAAYLKPACVHPRHYEEIKVGYPFSLLNNDTAAALQRLVELNKIGKDVLPTAWFAKSISRTSKPVISHFNENQYEVNVSFLEDFIDPSVKIHIGSDAMYSWKPVPIWIVTATKVMLEVQKLFLEELDFAFFFLESVQHGCSRELILNPEVKTSYSQATGIFFFLKFAILSMLLRSSMDDAHPCKETQCRSGTEESGVEEIWWQEHCNEMH